MSSRSSRSLALALAACTLLVPASAQAQAPTDVTVGQANRHLTVNWTVPPGTETRFIEAAYSPAVDSLGYFLDYVYDSDLAPASPYTSSVQFAPGTYYVHVAGCSIPCAGSGYEFSTILPITIGADQWPPPPPFLTSVGQDGRHLTATWTTAASLTMDFIEVAGSPATDPDGYFLPDHLELSDPLAGQQQSYRSFDQLSAGTHYVHVAAYDPNCVGPTTPSCPDVFSSTAPVNVPPDVQALLLPPPSTDTVTSFLVLKVASSQRAKNLVVRVAMAETGTITVGGTVRVAGASKVYKLKSLTVTAVAGKTVNVRLKLPKKALRAVGRAIKRHRKVRANLTVTAKDAAGNAKTEKRSVRLKR